MGTQSQYWLIVAIGTLGSIWCLFWKTSLTLSNPTSVLAKASIELDLTVPSPTLLLQNNSNDNPKKSSSKNFFKKKLHKSSSSSSRFMMKLYNRRSNFDIVRALNPQRVSPSFQNPNFQIYEFQIPKPSSEILETAELLGHLGTIVRVETLDRKILSKSRINEDWRIFDITEIVKNQNNEILKLWIRTRSSIMRLTDDRSPILILNYGKPRTRRPRGVDEDDRAASVASPWSRGPRAVNEDDRDDTVPAPWTDEGGRRQRRRNLCRRRSLYVDFATIAYNEWVVAPPGYEAYQCVGKCFYPFGDHLSPTKHAIVQTLVHGTIKANDGKNNVGRACCVPTRLAPTSLLYIDSTGTLTYQYGYEDMVVAECGCR